MLWAEEHLVEESALLRLSSKPLTIRGHIDNKAGSAPALKGTFYQRRPRQMVE